MNNNNFTLIDKFTIVSIAMIGIFMTLPKVIDLLPFLNYEGNNDNLVQSMIENKNTYLSLIPYLTLTVSAIHLLIKASKTAWLFTATTMFGVTCYFSYQVLKTFLNSEFDQSILPLKVLVLGLLISLNFVLILLSLFLFSKSFKEKLNA
jgi:hypothetical protein